MRAGLMRELSSIVMHCPASLATGGPNNINKY